MPNHVAFSEVHVLAGQSEKEWEDGMATVCATTIFDICLQ